MRKAGMPGLLRLATTRSLCLLLSGLTLTQPTLAYTGGPARAKTIAPVVGLAEVMQAADLLDVGLSDLLSAVD